MIDANTRPPRRCTGELYCVAIGKPIRPLDQSQVIPTPTRVPERPSSTGRQQPLFRPGNDLDSSDAIASSSASTGPITRNSPPLLDFSTLPRMSMPTRHINIDTSDDQSNTIRWYEGLRIRSRTDHRSLHDRSSRHLGRPLSSRHSIPSSSGGFRAIGAGVRRRLLHRPFSGYRACATL